MRHSEIAADIFVGVPAFLMTDDSDGTSIDGAETADDGFVVANTAIAMQLDEIIRDEFDVVQAVGAVRMSGQLNLLPRG